MMRLLLASMVLLAVSVPAPSAGSPVGTARSISQPGAVAAAQPASRGLALVLSPAPNDLALAEIGFRGPRVGRISSRLLHVAVKGAFGDDYMVAAWLRSRAGPRALVLVVNRPSSLMDPVRVHLRLSWRSRLGSAFTRVWSNPIAKGAAGASFCSLTAPGRRLTVTALQPLGTRGSKLGEIEPTSAISQAYDLSCGLSSDPAFKQALTGGCMAEAGCEQPAPAPESPPVPAPEPAPPGCTPCDPRPGFACPLVARPAICAAPVVGGSRRLSAGSH